MATANEIALAEAKKKFSSAVDDFGLLTFIRERPLATAGIALLAGVLAGMLRLPKLKTFLPLPAVLRLFKKH
ncbi:MAG: hypothetical protein Q4E34_04185 [Synergistaceae bacterium]|nr:hypothetical protein [Synergistaceae bacterium]